MFAKSLIIAAVAGLASSVPLTSRDSPVNPSAFGLIATRSGSPVHLRSITASDYKLWIGLPTSAYCPASVGDACPPGNETAFLHPAGSSLYMDAEVPGGQQVYVTADGGVGYTIPHSAALPNNSITTGWVYTPNEPNQVGSLVFANGTIGFAACPVYDLGNYTNVYSIVASNGHVSTDCYGINLATVTYDGGYAAWEYN